MDKILNRYIKKLNKYKGDMIHGIMIYIYILMVMKKNVQEIHYNVS